MGEEGEEEEERGGEGQRKEMATNGNGIYARVVSAKKKKKG